MTTKHFFKTLVFIAFCIFSSCSNDNNIVEQLEQDAQTKPKFKSASYSSSNWMELLSNNSNLAKISIPGSHDAAARVEPVSGTAKCQNLSLTEQYNAGVRYVDIRCRHLNNAFVIHHGSIYQNLNFDDVLNSTINFLNSNPSECVIMSVKEEYNASGTTRSFEETFDSYVAKNPSKWYLTEGIPTLGQVRGKIVLLRRFGANSAKGIAATNWPDNTTFSINNGSYQLRVQDYYNNSSSSAKWNSINSFLSEASSGNYETMYINYTSGYRSILGIPSITSISGTVNSNLYNYFGTNTCGRYGIIAMDFTDTYRCGRIINTNFPITSGTYSIVSKQSGLALDDPGHSTTPGTNIILWSNSGAGNQKWIFTPTGGGYYAIINQTSMLAIDGDVNLSETLLIQWNPLYHENQLWLVKPTQNGYSFISQRTGLAIDGGSNASNVKIQLWGYNGTDNQTWYIQ